MCMSKEKLKKKKMSEITKFRIVVFIIFLVVFGVGSKLGNYLFFVFKGDYKEILVFIASLLVLNFLLFEIYGAIVSDKTQELFPKKKREINAYAKNLLIGILFYSLISFWVVGVEIIGFFGDSLPLRFLIAIILAVIVTPVTFILGHILMYPSK